MAINEKGKIGSLLPSRFNVATFHRNEFHAKAEKGTKRSDIEDPSYWSHVCAPMNVGDHIEVMEESGAWWAELLVVSAVKKETNDTTQEKGTQRIRVSTLHFKPLGESTADRKEDAGVFNTHFAEGTKWSVIREHDSHRMVEGLDTEKEALEWIEENIKKKKAA